MSYMANLAIGEKAGTPRVWIQSKALAREGFEAGKPIEIMVAKDCITITASESGKRIVSGKTARGSVTPIIELHNLALANWLPAHAKRVRITAEAGIIEIVVHQDDDAEQARLDSIKARLKAGKPLRIGEVCVGVGVLSDAIHEGLKRAGVASEVTFAVEKEKGYLDQFIKTSRGATGNTLFCQSGMEELDISSLPDVDIVCAGLPCTGASLAGRAKNKLASAEEHKEAGSLFFTWLAIVKQFARTGAVIMLENVPSWSSTASQVVIRSCLEQWGYDVYESEVDQTLGAFEARTRFCMVAVTKGFKSFDFSGLMPAAKAPQKLVEVLEEIPADDSSWKQYSYIFEKEKKDIAAGKSFRTQIVTESSTKVGVIPRHYAKVQSTNPLLKHPEKELYRLLTPTEHARVKGAPLRLIEGLSATVAHQILGQGVLWPAFVSVWKFVGELLTGQKMRGALAAVEDITASPSQDNETSQMALFT